jgi:hypothetical protein
MSTPLEIVQHLLVPPDNPSRQTALLDSQRCVELHNAILEHGWLGRLWTPSRRLRITVYSVLRICC